MYMRLVNSLILILLSLVATAQQWVTPDGDTLRVIQKSRTTVTSTYGVIGVKDSFYSVKAVVPVFGITNIPFTFTYDTVVLVKKQAASIPFTLTPAAVTARVGAGMEYWHGEYNVKHGTPKDRYYRFIMSEFYNTDGTRNWRWFDQEFQNAINAGLKFSFGIMQHNASANSGSRGIVTVPGGLACYPKFLHDAMMKESVKPYTTSETKIFVPNWNSEHYLKELEVLHADIAKHIRDKGWSDYINYIDIRGYGSYGEWHHAGIASNVPVRATVTTLKRIIDSHTKTFTDWPLVIIFNAFDANRLNNTLVQPEIAHYALTQRNSWGLIGWRRDNWGATDDYIRRYTDLNTVVVNGMRLDTAIMNRWKYAPIVGEPNRGWAINVNGCDYGDLENQVRKYHAVSFGNGNMSTFATACIQNNVKAAADAAGHKLTITDGRYENGYIYIEWQNNGITPVYEKFDVVCESGGKKFSAPLPVVMPGEKVTQRIAATVAGELHIFVRNNVRAYPMGVASRVI